jgi:hypothetical protein
LLGAGALRGASEPARRVDRALTGLGRDQPSDPIAAPSRSISRSRATRSK